MTHRERPQRNSAELSYAREKKVDPHGMPDVIPLSRVAGGVTRAGRSRLISVRRMQCHGGQPRNVDFSFTGTGIIGECSSCGTNVYWESRRKMWTT